MHLLSCVESNILYHKENKRKGHEACPKSLFQLEIHPDSDGLLSIPK
jgi:hypothetical protein